MDPKNVVSKQNCIDCIKRTICGLFSIFCIDYMKLYRLKL